MSFAHVRGSAPMMSAAHLPLTTEGMFFSRLSVNERSAVAVVTGKVASTCSRMVGLNTGMQCMLFASTAVLGGSAAACQRCFHCPQLKLGSELVVTVVDQRLIHFHRRQQSIECILVDECRNDCRVSTDNTHAATQRISR